MPRCSDGTRWMLAGFWIFATLGAFAQTSSFAKLQFGETIFIEVPRNWSYIGEQVRQHLNTGSEAVGRLAGLSVAQGDNDILFAANAFTTSKSPSATARLSIRRGDAPTQADIRELSRLPRGEADAVFRPVIAEIARGLRSVEGVRSAKPVGWRVDTNESVACIFAEFETAMSDGVMMSQTWQCPLGDRAVKLSTSYRKSEAHLFRPTIALMWSSLRAR